MKYLFINSVYGVRSTGKLISSQCKELHKQGHTCAVAYGRECVADIDTEYIRIGTKLDYMLHALLSRLFDVHGLASRRATKQFLKRIAGEDFDCIWLHNIHGYYLHYPLLFQWLKQHPDIQVYWTLHDCWAFTGHCAYFTMQRCQRWKEGCHHCPQLSAYPKAMHIDGSERNYRKKKNAFCGVKHLTLITPSQWLADLTRESFLSEYPVRVVRNEVDTSVFHPTESDIKKRLGIEDKKMILGVAVGWEETKGYQDILRLRECLDVSFSIVLVGVSKEQIAAMPAGMIGFERTADQAELVRLYSAADVLVNPTHQDNYPTVNLEAIACGTPAVTYNVGGSPETTLMKNVVEENDIEGLALRICEICNEGNTV